MGQIQRLRGANLGTKRPKERKRDNKKRVKRRRKNRVDIMPEKSKSTITHTTLGETHGKGKKDIYKEAVVVDGLSLPMTIEARRKKV